MRESFQCVVTLPLVTIAAYFDLGRNMQDRISRCVTGMTIRARDLVAGVRSIVPAETDIIAVTIEAHSVLRLDRRH